MATDLRTLRSFVTVASAGSISSAAERLYIAQPALSLQMKNLEQDLGVQLLERIPRGVRLTEAGRRLLDHATHLLRQFEVACDDVREGSSSPRGSVVVGLSQSIAKQLVVPLVQQTLARWPHIRLSVTELSTGYIPANVLSGHIDMGFVFHAEPNPALVFEHLVDEELVVVAAAGRFGRPSGAAARSVLHSIRLEDLLTLPLVVPAPAHGLRTLIDRYLQAEHRPLNILAEVNTIPQMIELAAAGVGCSILSHASVVSELAAGQLSAARVKGMRMQRPVSLVMGTGRPISAATAAVHQLVRRIVRSQVASRRWPAQLVSSAAATASL